MIVSETKKTRRKAVLRVSCELIIAAMHLPADIQITDCRFQWDSDTVEFLIEHKDLDDVEEGYCLPRVYAKFNVNAVNLAPNIEAKEVVFVGWQK